MKRIIDIPNELAEKEHWYTDREMWTVIKAAQNGIPLEQIRAEIERLHYHPKLDFIKNDEVVDMALDIIDKYRGDKPKTDLLDKIMDEIEREADYQDANVNADVAKGMYMALDMIDKYREERGI